jgi:hypothetical protein
MEVSELPGLMAGLVRLSFLVQAIYADTYTRLGITPAQSRRK